MTTGKYHNVAELEERKTRRRFSYGKKNYNDSNREYSNDSQIEQMQLQDMKKDACFKTKMFVVLQAFKNIED